MCGRDCVLRETARNLLHRFRRRQVALARRRLHRLQRHVHELVHQPARQRFHGLRCSADSDCSLPACRCSSACRSSSIVPCSDTIAGTALKVCCPVANRSVSPA